MYIRTEFILAAIAALFVIPAAVWWIERFSRLRLSAASFYREIRKRLRVKVRDKIFEILSDDTSDSEAPARSE